MPANIVFQSIDLSSRASVRDFVDSWSSGTIASLVLNAGMLYPGPPRFDKDNLEQCFSVNHVNQAFLFFLLHKRSFLDRDCRVVFVSSELHNPQNATNRSPPAWRAPAELAKGEGDDGKVVGQVRYATAKLATIYFAYALIDKLDAAKKIREGSSTKYTVIIYEPGFVPAGTGLGRSSFIPITHASSYFLSILQVVLKHLQITRLSHER